MESLREVLQLGARPDAGATWPGFASFAQQVVGWSVMPAMVPRLQPWSESEVRSALEALTRAGLPPELQKRIQVAREEPPPYGLEPRTAWELKPKKRATKPTLRCDECDTMMRPRAELSIPSLGEKQGARTVRIYECEVCSEEEPTEEYVRLTVEPKAPRNAPRPRSFADYPDVSEAEQLQPPGFVASRYADFLQQQGLKEVPPVQLGGYAHGIAGDEALIAMRAGTRPPCSVLTVRARARAADGEGSGRRVPEAGLQAAWHRR